VRGAFDGVRAVVIGFGASGRAAADVLAAEGAEVWVSEARPIEDIRASKDTAVTAPDIRAGGHRPEHLDGATLVVTSPGVPQDAPVLEWAHLRGLPIWSELELGARLCRVPYVAVTGTNGKTTTVELVAEMMRMAGLRARACGNVGYPFSLAAREPFEALAVEASSFQLRYQESLHPKVSVLLNLAPDHLDWHGSYPEYAAAKARVFRLQGEGDTHVGNRDDAEGARLSTQAPCRQSWFRSTAPGVGETGVVGGAVVLAEASGVVEVGRPRGVARPFLVDAAAAVAAGLAFGLPVDAARRAVDGLTPLPHRGSVVATVHGVRFVDDSKATNPHASLAALDGLSDAVLIAGGLAKGVDLSPLAAAAPSLAGVVAIGESGPQVARVFEGLVPVRAAATMEEAVSTALEMAPPQGTVILAPGCASQDMFRDYEERGDRFTAAALALAEAMIRG
jgi:UDP-N-acetylmuramoylalanine--D-glutamate ligase